MWLEGVSHALASLACCADSELLAARLFAVTPQPLHLPMPELQYDILDVASPIEGTDLPEGPLLKVRAAECPVWLMRVPDVHPPPARDMDHVTFSLDVEAGRSRIRADALRQIRCGDVLLVRDAQRRLSCGGRVIGGYQLEAGSAMLETFTQPDMSPDDERTYEGLLQPTSGLPVDQLPVELVFVLQRERMTLAELRQLAASRLLPLRPGAEQQVEVRVNDTLLARGELVQLDGKLGVEISQWFAGPDHVE
jgi:type III secretion protein Q